VLADVADGKVSSAAAGDVYGVAVSSKSSRPPA